MTKLTQETEDVVAELHALADRQRRERGDVMYLGEHDPEISKAAELLERLSDRIDVLRESIDQSTALMEEIASAIGDDWPIYTKALLARSEKNRASLRTTHREVNDATG